MFFVDEAASILGEQGQTYPGTFVAWTRAGFAQLIEFIRQQNLPEPSLANNEPWAGLFIIEGARHPSHFDTVRLSHDERNVPVIMQSSNMDTIDTSRPATFGTVAFGEAAFGGSVTREIPRWYAELSGVEPFIGGESLDPPTLSDASALVHATTLRDRRIRALNQVEDLALVLAGSDDRDEKLAGDLGLLAVEALRPYVDVELDPARFELMRAVIKGAVDFITFTARGVTVATALRKLAAAFGIDLALG